MKTTLDYENELVEKFISYGTTVNFIEKKPKMNSFIFEADNKLLCLKKVYVKENVLSSNYTIQNQLLSNELFTIETMVKTLEDTFYVSVNDIPYVAFNHIRSESLDFKEIDDISLFFKGLLAIEKSLETVNLKDENLQNFVNNKKIDLDVKKSNNILKQLFKNIQNQKKKTDFDLTFINTYNKMSKNLKYIEDNILKLDIYKNREFGVVFNSTYVEKANNLLVIKTPTTLAYGSKYIDLYGFLCKYIKKTDLESIRSFDEIIALYDPNIDITKKETMKFLLQYPFKYINIMVQYYDKKRNFVPTEILSDLDEYALFKVKVEKFLDI